MHKDEIEDIIIKKAITDERKRNFLIECEEKFNNENQIPYKNYKELKNEILLTFYKAMEDGIEPNHEFNFISVHRITPKNFEIRISEKENSYCSTLLEFPIEMLTDYENFKNKKLAGE